MVSSSSSSNKSYSSSDTYDNKIAADGEATVVRNDGGKQTIYNTADIAVDLTNTLADTLGNAAYDAFGLAEDAGDDARAISMQALDFAQTASQQSQQASQQALEVVDRNFGNALVELREDDTQIASQLITYGIPAIAIFLLWSTFK